MHGVSHVTMCYKPERAFPIRINLFFKSFHLQLNLALYLHSPSFPQPANKPCALSSTTSISSAAWCKSPDQPFAACSKSHSPLSTLSTFPNYLLTTHIPSLRTSTLLPCSPNKLLRRTFFHLKLLWKSQLLTTLRLKSSLIHKLILNTTDAFLTSPDFDCLLLGSQLLKIVSIPVLTANSPSCFHGTAWKTDESLSANAVPSR